MLRRELVVFLVLATGCGHPEPPPLEVAHRLIDDLPGAFEGSQPRRCALDADLRPALGCPVPLLQERLPVTVAPDGRTTVPLRLPADGEAFVAAGRVWPQWKPFADLVESDAGTSTPGNGGARPGLVLDLRRAGGRPESVDVTLYRLPPLRQSTATPPVEIVPGSVLEVGFGLDVLSVALDGPPIEFRVLARTSRGETELLRKPLDPSRGEAGGWSDHRLDLADLAGETASFVLETRAMEKSGSRAVAFPLWSPVNILSPGGNPSRRDAILLTVGAIRLPTLEAYGGPPGSSPAFGRLAAKSTLFQRTLAASAAGPESRRALLTGLYGPSAAGGERPDPEQPAHDPATLAQHFAEAGYLTAAIVEDPRAPTSTEARGFDSYRFVYDPPGDDGRRRGALAAAAKWIEQHPGVRIFLFVSAGRGTLDELDRSLDEFSSALAMLGEEQRAVLVLTADCGSPTADRPDRCPALDLRESSIRIPLLLSSPGLVPAGLRIPETVSSVDIAPTILALAGLPPRGSFQGKSLAPLLRNGRLGGFDDRAVFSELPPPRGPALLAVSGSMKWVFDERPGGRVRAFDLDSDPAEMRALKSPHLLARGESIRARFLSPVARPHSGGPAPGP